MSRSRTWRVALGGFGATAVGVGVIAVLAWLGLISAAVASKGRLVGGEELAIVGGLVGLIAGIAIGRWGAIYLPLTVLGPTLVFDVVRHAFASGVERYDPRPPLTLFLVIAFVGPACVSVAGGVVLRKLGEAVRPGGRA